MWFTTLRAFPAMLSEAERRAKHLKMRESCFDASSKVRQF
jgi:hypothetical protein